MKHCFLLTAFSLFTISLRAQSIFIGDKKYPCSQEIEFADSASHYLDPIHLLFVNKGDGTGYFMVRCHCQSYSVVKGTVILYLEDDSQIKFVDNKRYDSANGIYTTIYNLTTNEIAK